MFMLIMKYTLGSFAPSYIFHNHHKTSNNLYLFMLFVIPKPIFYLFLAAAPPRLGFGIGVKCVGSRSPCLRSNLELKRALIKPEQPNSARSGAVLFGIGRGLSDAVRHLPALILGRPLTGGPPFSQPHGQPRVEKSPD